MSKGKSTNPQLTEAVQKAKKGDEQGFRYIFDHYSPKIHRYLYFICKKPSLAEELTQETFLKAFQNMDKLDSAYALSSWLHSVALRLFLDFKKVKKNSMLQSYEAPPEEGYVPKGSQLSSTVSTILDSLDDEEKNALLFVDLAEYSYEEAAKAMSLPLKQFRNVIRRARRKFVEYCEQNKIEITGIFKIPERKIS